MSLLSAAECLLLTTMLYSAGLVACAECEGLQQWIAATQHIVDTVLLFVHPPPHRNLDPSAIADVRKYPPDTFREPGHAGDSHRTRSPLAR
jgi:hypothetical protein